MSDTNNRHVGESKISGVPSKKFNLTIKDGSVATSKLQDKSVTLPKLNNEVIYYIENRIQDKAATLQNQIDSLELHGVAMSNEFGDNTHIGVSQYTLTQAINNIWNEIDAITGNQSRGVTFTVTPEYFFGDDSVTVDLLAESVDSDIVFEHIAFYADGQLIAEDSNVASFATTIELYDTTEIECVAKILGVEYIKKKTVTHYAAFWLGAGNTYSDIMDTQHAIPITQGLRGAYDVTCTAGQRIIIVMGESLATGFIRADINSVEIPFTQSTVTIDNKVYKIYTSVNAYQAGTYNIDING